MKFLTFILFLISYYSASSEEYIIKIKSSKNSTIQSSLNLKPVFNTQYLSKKKDNKIQDLSDNFLNSYFTITIDKIQLNEIRNMDEVIDIFPNFIYKVENLSSFNDPDIGKLWNLDQLDVRRVYNDTLGKGVIIALIDTGLDFNHPEFENQLWINGPEDLNGNGIFDPWPHTEEINGVFGDLNGIDEDNNGIIDDIIGYDFVDQFVRNVGDDQNWDPIPQDEGRHGTQVAGVMSAKPNNNFGIVGLSPGSKLMVIRAFDATGNGESDDIAKSIVYAALNGAKVINMSFGESNYSPLIHDAIKFAFNLGCVLISSSGNNNWYFEHYPSDLDEVISVGATNVERKRFGRSNYGNRLDLMAPGQSVPTTAVNSSFTNSSGTSLAAPHISSLAAIILSINNKLHPDVVKSILIKNSNNPENFNWDIFYGNGIPSLESILKEITYPKIGINFPTYNIALERDKYIEGIPIIGSTIHPQLRFFEIDIRKGTNPFTEPDFQNIEQIFEWTNISGLMYNQKLNDTLIKIDISNLKDTIYTIRIAATLVNGKKVEFRTQFELYSNNLLSRNSFEYVKDFDVYFNDRRRKYITAVTTKASRLSLELFDNIDTVRFQEYDIAEKSHSILVDKEIMTESSRGELKAIRNKGDTIVSSLNLKFRHDDFNNNLMTSKSYNLPFSYFNKSITQIDGEEFIAINRLQGIDFGKTYIYKFSNEEFILFDSLESGFLPQGFGDSNGDGNPEVLLSGGGQTLLYEYNNGRFFNKLIYRNTPQNIEWATNFQDIDGDGRSEIIGRTDSSFYVLKSDNNEFRKIAEITLPKEIRFFDNFISAVVGDFDNNGLMEIAFCNSLGMVFIYELTKNYDLIEKYVNLFPISSSGQFLSKGDLNGDGVEDLIILNAGGQLTFSTFQPKERIWYAQAISYQNGSYQKIWDEMFYGVRQGIAGTLGSYKNGISTGDITGNGKDEIFISAYPNLYIFSSNENDSIVPLWHNSNSFSNDIIIHDFDDNGVSEFGYTSFSGLRFYEFTDEILELLPPAGFIGEPIDRKEAKLTWRKVENATNYLIYRIADYQTGEGLLYGNTSELELLLDTLTENTNYDFFILSENSDKNILSRPSSQIVSIYTHDKVKPQNYEFINDKTLRISFSDKLPKVFIESGTFELKGEDITFFPLSVFTNNHDVNLIFEEMIPNGNYLLDIAPFRDFYGQLTNRNSIHITKELIVNDELIYLTNLEVLSLENIRLHFSHDLNETALKNENYSIQPFGNILNAEFSENDRIIDLKIDLGIENPVIGKNFIVTALDKIKSKDNLIKMTDDIGNSMEFSFTSDNIDNVFVYPSPIRLSLNSEVMFANLTRRAIINIYDSEGRPVRSLIEQDGNGGVEWDVKNKNGNKVDPGIYFYKVIELNGNQEENESGFYKFLVRD